MRLSRETKGQTAASINQTNQINQTDQPEKKAGKITPALFLKPFADCQLWRS